MTPKHKKAHEKQPSSPPQFDLPHVAAALVSSAGAPFPSAAHRRLKSLAVAVNDARRASSWYPLRLSVLRGTPSISSHKPWTAAQNDGLSCLCSARGERGWTRWCNARFTLGGLVALERGNPCRFLWARNGVPVFRDEGQSWAIALWISAAF
jgi:hypothetical protein